MNRIPEQGRLTVEGSLFERLRAVRPDLQVLSVTKSTLVATSHLIETLVHDHQERCVLVSGFQHGRHWAAERDRYLALSTSNDMIAVFAGHDPLSELGTDHVGLRLRTGDSLAQEWFVLALGPGLAITLCGLDGDAHAAQLQPVREADRLFDVVWSVDPAVAEVAANVVVEALRRSAPDRVEAVAARLEVARSRQPSAAEAARATDTLLGGMVQRLEATRLREKSVLAAASAHKSTFLSRMSHELRTPLNAMLGFAQLLELDVVDADQQQSVAQVLAAGRHVVSLVDEILDIGRIEAGELQLDLRDIALGPVVAGALAMLAPLAAERGIELVEDVGAVGPVRADEDRLRQVLLNLVSNGVKYNHDGGRLVVAALRTPDAVRLSVRDTGWGMSQAQVDTLFVPFERLDAASRGINGTGLGLVVTQRLVEAMGGHLEVDSRPGVGTTFTLALPASPADPPRAP
ncbi:MAG TPA: ATP-binding protein [Mycobacteriales bacterium]|jgi:signal transduction histidine kinase|nr:ATP-binding protein [Mycobacteriales bacterium]